MIEGQHNVNFYILTEQWGHAIVQAVGHWFPNAAE
jgi:hypothetical protein